MILKKPIFSQTFKSKEGIYSHFILERLIKSSLRMESQAIDQSHHLVISERNLNT